MLFMTSAAILFLSSAVSAAKEEETQSLYGQCGGRNYVGPTACPLGAMCYTDGTNPWYSQCVEHPWESGSPQPPPPPTAPPPVVTTTVTLIPDDPWTWDRRRDPTPEPIPTAKGERKTVERNE
ncbi:hypothetical protein F4778DRAFT_776794 [Xylariomycetidae sp. FL2044]|nr:hypothetical protein F4778DRAFT_776794 [Xylariomycetidae sp. FL2044]